MRVLPTINRFCKGDRRSPLVEKQRMVTLSAACEFVESQAVAVSPCGWLMSNMTHYGWLAGSVTSSIQVGPTVDLYQFDRWQRCPVETTILYDNV